MREVIKWPIRVWLIFIALNVAIIISIGVVLSDTALIIFTAALSSMTLIFSITSRIVLTASKELLTVGGANIESRFIKEVVVLDETSMKYERGAGLNPRAFLAIRFWVKTGAKIILEDQRDPTPYWLVSTRRPEEIKSLLEK
jgi:hypothetical protein